MVKKPAAGSTVPGLDISHYQPHIDLASEKARGAKFCFIKATEGTSAVDSRFHEHWALAKQVGLIRGAYHFFHPSEGPYQQAEHFCKTVGALGTDDLPCVMDWESTDGVPSSGDRASALVFLDRVKTLTGKQPIIYSGPYFLDAMKLSSPFEQYPLWVAQYGTKAPLVPTPWSYWSFWQTSGSVVDRDVFNGTLEQLMKIAHG